MVGLCSYPAMMSVYFLGHVSELVMVVFALLGFRSFLETGRLAPLALGSSAASLTFLVRFPGVLAGPALAFYLAHCLHERRRREPRRFGPDLAAVGAPLAVALALHVGTNYLQWGSAIASPVIVGGLETNGTFFRALAGFLISPGIGVFAYSPLLLLLPWTLRAAARRWPWECAAIAIYAATQLLYYANYRFWTGLWSAPGPRYLFPSCALLLLSLGAWLELRHSRLARAALTSLAAVGAVIQIALLTADWQEVTKPLHAAEWQAAVASGRYENYDPDFAFLFDPAASPIWGVCAPPPRERSTAGCGSSPGVGPESRRGPRSRSRSRCSGWSDRAGGALGMWRAVAKPGA